jgi:hypothetical protein
MTGSDWKVKIDRSKLEPEITLYTCTEIDTNVHKIGALSDQDFIDAA